MKVSVHCPHCNYSGDFTKTAKNIKIFMALGICIIFVDIIVGIVGFSKYFKFIVVSFIVASILIAMAMSAARCPQCNHENIVRRTEK